MCGEVEWREEAMASAVTQMRRHGMVTIAGGGCLLDGDDEGGHTGDERVSMG